MKEHYWFILKLPKKFLIGVLLALFFGFSGAFAMDEPPEDPDQLFMQAREYAFDERYQQARNLCDQILEYYPDYHDVKILKARTYAWEGNYKRAKELLLEVRNKDPKYRDALYALIDVEMWSENYDNAISLIDLALKDLPNNTNLLYRKALALTESGDDTAAVVILNQILELDPSYVEATDLLNTIENAGLTNHIGLGYRGQYFLETNTEPWHLTYLEIGRKTSFLGPATLRTNWANLWDVNSYQIEIETYPTIRPGTYLFLNAGYSPESELFPVTKFGFELFQSLPAAWEISAGFRLLNFNDKDLLVLTGSISKYLGNYLLSARPYFAFSSDGNDPNVQSLFFTARRFFSSPDHYLNLRVGRGFSADFDQLSGGEIYDVGGTTLEAMLTYQHKFSNRFLFRLGAGYKLYDQEVIWGNPFIAETAIIYRF
ncbi:MAG: YaiO family outer membrane beta-barrel protein [Bacteroidota bacterium]